MTIFAVMATSANPQLEGNIGRAYPDARHYKISDRTWLVSDTATAKQVTEKLGVKKGGITGVAVMPTTSAYYGVASSALWDWIRSALEESADG
jgi:hypothetical protein